MEINKEKFFKAAAQIERPGKRALLEWLERETDFFTAPASTNKHLAQPGGLVAHSLDVYKRLRVYEVTWSHGEQGHIKPKVVITRA